MAREIKVDGQHLIRCMKWMLSNIKEKKNIIKFTMCIQFLEGSKERKRWRKKTRENDLMKLIKCNKSAYFFAVPSIGCLFVGHSTRKLEIWKHVSIEIGFCPYAATRNLENEQRNGLFTHKYINTQTHMTHKLYT